MVTIYGEIGTFLEIKKSLGYVGIQINSLEDYTNEIKKIEKVKLNIHILSQEMFNDYRNQKIQNYHLYIQYLDEILHKIKNGNIFKRIILKAQLYILRKKITLIQLELMLLEKERSEYINKFSIQIKNNLEKKSGLLDAQKNNYYGALGEIETQNHLQNLYIDSKLINNFSKYFSKAIPMKGGHDWIQSVQIDHILINQKGIFLIETKNWSKYSEKEIVFSPLHQAKRHNHAFYFYFKDYFLNEIGFLPKIYNIVTKKQLQAYKYCKEFYVYEIPTSKLNTFIQSRPNQLSDFHVEKILKILQ